MTTFTLLISVITDLPVHSTPAGSGRHTPALVQVAVISPSGDNPGLHWKVITDPSVVTMLS